MSLRDALLKAGKISKKQARHAETETRKSRKKRKGHLVEQDREAAQLARHEERQAKQRAADLERARIAKEEHEAHERQVRIKNLIYRWKRYPARRTSNEFWFVRSDGFIGLMMVDRQSAAELEFGQAGIVEPPGNPTGVLVVKREGVQKLLEIAPEVVRFYVGEGAPVDDETVCPPRLLLPAPPVAPAPQPSA